MDSRKILDEVYRDFFGTSKETTITANKEININSSEELLVDEESKELIDKIVTYMKNYDNGVYINFNILFYGNNKETLSTVINLLKRVSNNYLINTNVTNISLTDIDDINKIKDYYKSGILVISDFNSLSGKNAAKLINILKDNSTHKNIVILNDTESNLKEFIKNDNDLENSYFTYSIKEILPDTKYIVDDIKKSINIDNLNDIEKYINDTFLSSNLDYPTYRDNLIKYIAFNNKLPEVNKPKKLEDILKDLNDLIGLDIIKKSINELIDLISLKNKTAGKVKINDVNLHMVFLGNPGTGKTTVARLLAEIFYDLKYIKYNKLVEVSAKDLIGEYVGQTGPKTNEVINKAMGGVLFIDEAYTLYSKSNSYNEEAIATLIKAMEDHRNEFIVIFAGYTKEMTPFLNSNSGIKSRIGYTFEFPDYTSDELIEIFKLFAKKSNFKIKDKALIKVKNIFEKHLNDDNFGNARFARNLYEKCVINHATNCKDIVDENRLKTITEEDIIDI